MAVEDADSTETWGVCGPWGRNGVSSNTLDESPTIIVDLESHSACGVSIAALYFRITIGELDDPAWNQVTNFTLT